MLGMVVQWGEVSWRLVWLYNGVRYPGAWYGCGEYFSMVGPLIFSP